MKKSELVPGALIGKLTLVAVERKTIYGHSIWRCHCTCGAELLRRDDNIAPGNRGCPTCQSTRHGQSGTPIYGRWCAMWDRTKTNTHYLKRGITVCDHWRSFDQFFEDMGPSFHPELTLERIDNDRGYSPDNCRWATVIDQARNKTTTVLVDWEGEQLCAAAWDERLGLRQGTVAGRLKNGWPVRRALMTDPGIRRRKQLDLDFFQWRKLVYVDGTKRLTIPRPEEDGAWATEADAHDHRFDLIVREGGVPHDAEAWVLVHYNGKVVYDESLPSTDLAR